MSGQQQAVPALQEDWIGLRSKHIWVKMIPCVLAQFIQFMMGWMMDAGKVHGAALACESFPLSPEVLSK